MTKTTLDFKAESYALLQTLLETHSDITRALGGSNLAARKGRVGLLKLEKMGFIFRQDSIQLITGDGLKNDAMEPADYLPVPDEKLVKKKHAWVAFTRNNDRDIIDLRVYDTKNGRGCVDVVKETLSKHGLFLSDLGNSCMGWEEKSREEFMGDLQYRYPIKSNVIDRVVSELDRIEW